MKLLFQTNLWAASSYLKHTGYTPRWLVAGIADSFFASYVALWDIIHDGHSTTRSVSLAAIRDAYGFIVESAVRDRRVEYPKAA